MTRRWLTPPDVTVRDAVTRNHHCPILNHRVEATQFFPSYSVKFRSAERNR